jgi:hypothetical protein
MFSNKRDHWKSIHCCRTQHLTANRCNIHTGQEMPTEDIKYQGKPLTRLPADESFPYLWIRASLVEMGRRKGPASSPGLSAEKQHAIAATKELVGITKRHQYLVGQMVPTMQMGALSRAQTSKVSAGAIPARLRSAWSTGLPARLPFPGKGGARHELALPSHASESTGLRLRRR